jgi:aryl-alcohol dehydrogenase-like predicted oxidoreductase
VKTRKLGRNGPEISVIGFGAWAIGGGDWMFAWGDQDDSDSIAAIHEALDHGINWIDTAAVYGLGHSEEVVGRALKGKREKVLIATKCSLVWDADKKVTKDHSPESVAAEIEASLKRLGTDVIDLYQVHWPPKEDAEIRPCMEVIQKAVEAGKIRYVGVSNFKPRQLDIAREICDVVSLQPPYSMFRRDIEKELMPYCAKHGIGIIGYSPMESGLLTGKFDAKTIAELPQNDWRRDKSDQFKEPLLSANLAVIEGLQPIAERLGCTLGQLAIAWTLRRSELSAAIVGARRPGQIAETAKAAELTLSAAELETIEGLLAARAAASKS